MEDIRKKLLQSEQRINHLIHLKEGSDWGNIAGMQQKFEEIRDTFFDFTFEELYFQVKILEEGLSFLEQRCEENLSPMERVRIVRSPQRYSLQDILENVYEEYTELGGAEETNVDPSMVVAKANILRHVKKRSYTQQVMVIGHEKGHGEEYRNGGCAKPWGNAKAFRYMLVAQTEGIPIHFYIFTPGSFPVEEYPGAAQQIASNIYLMTKLRVPMISLISEGGSGGAEALGLSDFRIMSSHGYYSVISPEGAAAIEGKIQEGEKIPKSLVEACAERLHITAEDNLRLGTIDRVIKEPLLGARHDDFAFFKRLRSEMMRATDEVVLKTKSLRAFRAYEVKMKKSEDSEKEEPHIDISWDLNQDEIKRLVLQRSRKYRAMACNGYGGKSPMNSSFMERFQHKSAKIFYGFRYDLLRSRQKQMQQVMQDVSGESSVFLKQLAAPFVAAYDFLSRKPEEKIIKMPVSGHNVTEQEFDDIYTSPLANEDRTVTCPNTEKCGCKDLWVPDLYGEFCGVCENCGHHFPLEYEWYMQHLLDRDSVREFNAEISAGNPLDAEYFGKRLRAAKAKTNRKSAIITVEARVLGVEIVVALLYSNFRNGTVGSAEGEKFVQACEKAKLKRKPFLSYIHTTGGIRIQEGTLGVVQMPKCTMAVREYVDSGGLYIVVYDNNSYAGPVASFLGCCHYQFAIRSSRIGFAGPRVIRETTGEDIPPDYHSALNALKRGHIQGIWDRREFRDNLHKALMTMGGRNLYYR